MPADALDDYELSFDELRNRGMLPQLENDIIISGTSAVASDNSDGFVVVTIKDNAGQEVDAYLTTERGFATWTIPNIPEEGCIVFTWIISRISKAARPSKEKLSSMKTLTPTHLSSTRCSMRI